MLGRSTAAAAGQLNRVGSGGVVYAAAPQERGAYAVARAGGPYNYGYNTGDGIAKVEVRQPTGTVVGSYRYFDPNGKQVRLCARPDWVAFDLLPFFLFCYLYDNDDD